MGCLDDQTLVALVDGRLPPAALDDVDEHLDTCAECRALVLSLTAAGREGGEAGEAETRARVPASPGTTFGRFVVLEPVGAGAMGVVHAAYDPQLDRRVALKLMRTDTDQEPEQARARLVREARAMARLSHPNVIAVYDVGTVGDAVFVAMELVEGQDLRRWCEAAPRSWTELRDVYGQAAAGLAAAHAAGLVHRDFKPDNVIVGPQGRARVGDFGLARPMPSPPTEEATGGSQREPGPAVTASSAVAGTPAYMAPEVLAGQPADARSDQYALCVAFYEAVAGTHPYPARTVAGLQARIETGRIEPPVRRAAPGWLLAVLTRGMSLRPEDRFEDMGALGVALRRDQRIRTRIGASLGALVLVGTATGAFWLGQRAPQEPVPCEQAPAVLAEVWSESTRATVETALIAASPIYGETTATTVGRGLDDWGQRWVRAHRHTCEATHVRGEQSEALLDVRMACLRDQLRQLDALAQRLEQPTPEVVEHAVDAVAALPAIERCADVDALTAIEPPTEPRVVAAIEALRPALAELRALVTTAQLTPADARVEALVQAAEATGHPPVEAEARLLHARVARGLGRLESAREAAYESLWAAQRARDDSAVAHAWLALQGIAGQRGEWDEAAHLGRHAEAAVERLGMPTELEATLRNARGIVFEQRGEYERARAELERALVLRREQWGEQHPEVARIYTNLGNLARVEGRRDEALALHERAMAIDRAALGPGHPAIGRHHHNLARLLLLAGEPERAQEHYRRALEIRQAVHGPRHPDVARTHNSLGLLWASQGEPERARAHYQAALQIFEVLDHPEQAMVRDNLERLDAPAPVDAPAPTQTKTTPRSKARRRTAEPAGAEPANVEPATPEPAKAEPQAPSAGVYAPGRAWDEP